MHPVIRIINLLVFILCLSRAHAGQLLLGFLILLPHYFQRPTDVRLAMKMVSRMRWFFLSILILYVWMAPAGQVPEISLQTHIPALLMGLERVGALLLIIFAVTYIISSLSREQLLGAIYWLAAPLKLFKLKRETLALRMVLSLEAVQQLLSEKKNSSTRIEAKSSALQKIKTWLTNTADVYHRLVQHADNQSCKEYTFTQLPLPKLYEWSFPLLLLILFQFVSYLEIYVNEL
ncbi:MAG: hypothetical protein OQK73_09950 [Gammaproteobacteria bacterium]|nr:hypothetical protein [Gammaproteobacteria bacterium]